jgi:hypothetical protein
VEYKEMKNSKEPDWDEKVRFRVGELDEEDIDFIRKKLIRLLINKHQKELDWITIFEIHPITINKETRYADILFENVKTKKKYAFEIQRGKKEKWENEVTKFYKTWNEKPSNFYCEAKVILVETDSINDKTTLANLRIILDKYAL